MAIFAYLRISTSNKNQTTDNQHKHIIDAGFNVDKFFADTGVSGSKPALERPQFSAMVSSLCSGDTIIVVAVDRLGRTASDVLNTVEYLKQLGVKVRIVQFDSIDLTSPTGKLLLTMLSAVAEMEKNLIVERVNSGLARTKSQGTILGAPKMDSETASHIDNLISQGISQSKVAEIAGVSLSTVKRFNKHIVKTNSLTSFKETAKIQTLQHNKRKENL